MGKCKSASGGPCVPQTHRLGLEKLPSRRRQEAPELRALLLPSRVRASESAGGSGPFPVDLPTHGRLGKCSSTAAICTWGHFLLSLNLPILSLHVCAISRLQPSSQPDPVVQARAGHEGSTRAHRKPERFSGTYGPCTRANAGWAVLQGRSKTSGSGSERMMRKYSVFGFGGRRGGIIGRRDPHFSPTIELGLQLLGLTPQSQSRARAVYSNKKRKGKPSAASCLYWAKGERCSSAI